MIGFRRASLSAVLLAGVLLAGCSLLRPQKRLPTLTVTQGSLRMMIDVESDGSIRLADDASLLGHLEIAPILESEGASVESVQVLLHQGRYYLTAAGFRNVWEVSPQPGTTVATYRPIPVSDRPVAQIRMSRYGPPGRACVRLDIDDGDRRFVGDAGELQDECL